MLVCFDEHFVRFDRIVDDPVTGEPLRRFLVFHEEGEERSRFVLSPKGDLTRWEIQYAAKEALKATGRRNRKPTRIALVS